MKRIVLTTVIISLGIITSGQVLPDGSGYSYKSGISRQETGKYYFSSAFSRDASSEILLIHPEGWTQPDLLPSTGSSFTSTSTIYHVVFHFDYTPPTVLCNGTDTVFFGG